MGKSKTRKIGLSLLLLVFVGLQASTQTCDHFIEKDILIIDGEDLNIQSGDVVCLEAGAREYLLIRNVDPNDTFSSPVTIQNYEGQLIIDTEHYYGISIQNCNNLIISGKGDPSYTYGIDIRRVENGSGIGVNNLSSKVEIEGCQIADTYFAGIIAKTDPYCTDGVIYPTRNDFTQYNIIIHDNYIHDTGGEGMYIGSSKFTGFTLECNGESQTVYPHVNIGVQIYDNIVESTGWDGIQISSVISDCNIYNNYILHDSEEGYTYQMSGILIGGGSQCDCYNNKIFDGKGDGIEIFGKGNMKIYNNLIVRAGETYYPGDLTYSKYGIYCDDVYTDANAYMYFYNNTIISPKSDGINFRNENISDVRAYNNLIVEPGAYSTIGEDAFIHIDDETITIDKQNNFFSTDVYAINFDSPANSDYDLQITSPVINQGKAISDFDFDIENRSRPIADKWDIGAYECNKDGVGIADPNAFIKEINFYPNPFNDVVNFLLDTDVKYDINVQISNILGVVVFQQHADEMNDSFHWKIPTNQWESGVYFYEVSYEQGSVTGLIIKK